MTNNIIETVRTIDLTHVTGGSQNGFGEAQRAGKWVDQLNNAGLTTEDATKKKR